MEIRRLLPAEADAYRALMLDGYRLHPDAFTATVAEREGLPLSWWQGRLAPDAEADDCVFGAWQQDRLVGVAGLGCKTRPKTAHKAALYGMYVEASSTRLGVGKRLVDAVLDEATRRGLRIVQLTVTKGNRVARELYERCGFVSFGTEPFAMRTEQGYASKVHMWIDLAQRSAARTKTHASRMLTSHA